MNEPRPAFVLSAFLVAPVALLAQGQPQGPEFQVNTYTESRQAAPSVAADSAGNFVVAWHSFTQDGSNEGVFGQRYSMIVPVEIQGFRVE